MHFGKKKENKKQQTPHKQKNDDVILFRISGNALFQALIPFPIYFLHLFSTNRISSGAFIFLPDKTFWRNGHA